MKSLILAEKPSVARELARVLDCNWKKRGYIEGKDYVVSWALGHLVTLAEPQDYDKKLKKWNLEDLPMLPEKTKLKIISRTRDQFNTVKTLMNRADIKEIIIATDAGREGELVARWIMEKVKWNGDVRRLWISSQTDSAIKEGFAALKPGKQYEKLYRAAVCRAESDWLIGLNVTRALTCKFNARLNAGRVQTPTLALIVQREKDIADFVPQDYWNIRADFGSFQGLWQTKDGNTRIFDQSKADQLVDKVTGGSGIIADVIFKAGKDKPPLAYDLTEMQRDANKKFGFSAKHTLDMAQNLYERHKLITYPRTDSRYITSDITKTLLQRLQRIYIPPYKHLVEQLLKNPLNLTKHLVNDKKVTDHHAILPTEQRVNLAELTADEKKVYDLVVRRFITVLYPDFIYNSVTVICEVKGEQFFTRGKVVKDQGWKAVTTEDKEDLQEQEQVTAEFKKYPLKGSKIELKNCKAVKSQTKPPSHYTESSLLAAMESPGKFIDDEDLRESIKAGGLGTPATRAEIIEKLIRSNYLERQGKTLLPTPHAFQLLELVPDELRSPELTARWEKRLTEIASGKEDGKEFMNAIRKNAATLVGNIKADNRSFKITNYSDTKCPQCGKYMVKFTTKLICSDHKCGYEISNKEERSNKKGFRSQRQKREDKQLVNRYGKEKQPNRGETLGDLFDFSTLIDKSK
ncbi:MAG: DNA topoisomerase III [Candidatus Cloacimonas sp. SDB]|nr:MAG: DNA topoisomerase III [Candidatus Cloacimonas sp. SDB]